MSDTYKDQIRAKFKESHRRIKWLCQCMPRGYETWSALSRIRHAYWLSLTADEQKIIVNYRKNPSWYNKLFNNRPKRCRDNTQLRHICRDLVVLLEKDLYSDGWEHPKKPCARYW